ncbi:MAG: hypothetical protein WCA06_05045 [Terrimicrobiaceae bacterium]
MFLTLSLLVADAKDPVLKVLIICFACSFPWALRAVQDFRPDVAVALFTAMQPELRLGFPLTR